ncbi:stearoyl-CoA 9-desaturase [Blastomyces gilchristii]
MPSPTRNKYTPDTVRNWYNMGYLQHRNRIPSSPIASGPTAVTPPHSRSGSGWQPLVVVPSKARSSGLGATELIIAIRTLKKDPYSVRKGFVYSHFRWMIMKQNPKLTGRTDVSDLKHDPVATFCVNSLAHLLGEQPFDDRNSPRDHVVTALVTLGEGYHNFHHEFPSDYRNAIEWHQYYPTKWTIWLWKQVGLAHHLKQFRANEIERGRLQQLQQLQQLQKQVDRRRIQLDWGRSLEELPVMEWEEYVDRAKKRGLVAIAGLVHDVTGFIKEHPGGKAMIQSGIGKDATAIFNGGVYNHSTE